MSTLPRLAIPLVVAPFCFCIACKRQAPSPAGTPKPSGPSAPSVIGSNQQKTKPQAPSSPPSDAVSKLHLSGLHNLREQPEPPSESADGASGSALPYQSQLPFSFYTGGASGFCGIVEGRSQRCFGGSAQEFGLGLYQTTAVGDDFSCVLIPSGEVRCLPAARDPRGTARLDADAGASDAGAVDAGAVDASADEGPARRTVALAAQGKELCLKASDGSVECYSRNPDCSLNPPQGEGFREVAVGKGCVACGITRAGALRCWGKATPVPTGGEKLTQVAVGSGFVCTLDEAKAANCSNQAIPKGTLATRIEARGSRVCWQEPSGRLSCNQGQPIEDSLKPASWAISETDLCFESDPGMGSIRCTNPDLERQIPDNPVVASHPSWAPTEARHRQWVEARIKLLDELLAPMQEFVPPLELDESFEIPVGRSVEPRFHLLLENLPLAAWDSRYPSRFARPHYHYGFRVKLPDGRRSAVFLRRVDVPEEGQLVWYVFGAEAELEAETTVMFRGHYSLPFDEGCVRGFRQAAGGEEVTRSSIDAKGNLKGQISRTQEQAAYDPINKRWVYVCTAYKATITGQAGKKSYKVSTTGFSETRHTEGLRDCEDWWPLGRPPWAKRVPPEKQPEGCR
jgi:hypothetical protein